MRKLLFALAIFLLCNGCTERGEDKVFVLPKGFVGYAIIIYDQNKGENVDYVNDSKRLYKIPPSRVLKTKFKADYGRTSLPEFYYGVINDKNRIPLVINSDDYSQRKVNASMPNIGKAYPDNEQVEPTEYSIFFIGTKEEIERASKEVKKIKILELK